MAYQIPQPMKQYNNPSANLPALTFREPREGKRYIPVEIIWDGVTKTQQINVQGITTQEFSQIVMIDVDNTLSGAEVTYYFTDSQDTLSVPPSSSGLFPVFTGQLTVYVSAPQALAGDVTRFRFLNYRQEPIGLPPPQFTNIVSSGNIVADGTYPLLAPSVSGTLVGYSVTTSLSQGGPSASVWDFRLKDTAANINIDGAVAQIIQDQPFNALILNVSGMAYRFAGGISATIATTVTALTGQNTTISLRYRTP